MTVRLAEASQAATLADLHGQVFADAAWDESFWTGAIAAAFDDVLILGEPPRAFAALRRLANEAEVLTVGTTAPGQGDGRRLMEAMILRATVAGAESLFLEVSTANKVALRLYDACGFKTVGRRQAYYRDGTDALILRRGLTRGD